MRVSVPDYLLFDTKAKTDFSVLKILFSYKLIECIKKPDYIRHTYRNRWRRRKIVIENQTSPVDYGFSISVYNLWTKEYFIIYNTPWEKQDTQCEFMIRAKNKIFNNDYLKNLIRGKTWKLKRGEFTFE